MAARKKPREGTKRLRGKGNESPEDLAEMRRQRRVEALKLIAGIWADREDIPRDGLEYQRQMRMP